MGANLGQETTCGQNNSADGMHLVQPQASGPLIRRQLATQNCPDRSNVSAGQADGSVGCASKQRQEIFLQGFFTPFAGADADNLFNVLHENLPIADVAGSSN